MTEQEQEYIEFNLSQRLLDNYFRYKWQEYRIKEEKEKIEDDFLPTNMHIIE